MLIGIRSDLGIDLKQKDNLKTLTDDVLHSSTIESEELNRIEARSSFFLNIGINIIDQTPSTRNVDSIVELMLTVTQNYMDLLPTKRLYSWRAALVPTGKSGIQKITIGAWRNQGSGSAHVVSGTTGREKVHFEETSTDRLDLEQQRNSLDIILWLDWLLTGLDHSFDKVDITNAHVLFKSRLWHELVKHKPNERQKFVLRRILDDDWQAYITTSKYAKIAKCSNDTVFWLHSTSYEEWFTSFKLIKRQKHQLSST